MYIGISTPTFDIQGNLLFKATISSTELKNLTRRVSRTATLDGGVSIIDSGYADGDRTFNITADLTETECDRLEYLIKNYSEVILAVPEGIFSVNLKSLQNFHGNIRLEILVNEKLAPIVAPPYYCEYDETFHDLACWYVTKKHGTETATIVTKGLDRECRIDLPNTLDTELKLTYQYIIPAGDFDIMLDTSTYTPDSALDGFMVSSKNSLTLFAGTTVNPSGFSISEAILATNLDGATPADMVKPVFSTTICLIFFAISIADPKRRAQPVTSKNASSMDKGSTNGVK